MLLLISRWDELAQSTGAESPESKTPGDSGTPGLRALTTVSVRGPQKICAERTPDGEKCLPNRRGSSRYCPNFRWNSSKTEASTVHTSPHHEREGPPPRAADNRRKLTRSINTSKKHATAVVDDEHSTATPWRAGNHPQDPSAPSRRKYRKIPPRVTEDVLRYRTKHCASTVPKTILVAGTSTTTPNCTRRKIRRTNPTNSAK